MTALIKMQDSTLSYYVNQLNALDRKLYEPLFNVTWSRDIQLRTDVTMANESTSFIRQSFGAVGSQSATGKPWLNPNSTAIPNVSINGDHVVSPVRLLGHEVTYSSVELERSQMTAGQSIDVQKYNALNKIYQMSTDEMVYIGDDAFNAKGLLNSTAVTTGSVANGASGSPLFTSKTPDEILKDINDMIQVAYTASGFALCPDTLLLPPTQFGYLASQKVSSAGNVSILTFLEDNSISLRINGQKLRISPVKWLAGRGTGSTDRMIAYTNNADQVRFPMVPIRRETPYYLGINYIAPYIWAFGEVEFVYPETVIYRDGI
jgi:hypothetical protein